MTPPTPRSLPPMLPEERAMSALSHLSTAIPLWAIVANALIDFSHRQSSRVVCLHARQGILFGGLLLLVALAKLLLDLLAKVVAVILRSGAVVEYVDRAGDWVFMGFYAVYVTICLWGVVRAIQGRVFVYPLVGGTLYAQYVAWVQGRPNPAPDEASGPGESP